MLQAIKQIEVLFRNTSETKEPESKWKDIQKDIDVLKEAMGAMQHHDAVTGTEKEAVAHDYALRIR